MRPMEDTIRDMFLDWFMQKNDKIEVFIHDDRAQVTLLEDKIVDYVIYMDEQTGSAYKLIRYINGVGKELPLFIPEARGSVQFLMYRMAIGEITDRRR